MSSEEFQFFTGLHQPSDAKNFDACFISVSRLRDRKSDFPVRKWMLDSGAFRTIELNGGYPYPPEEYAAQVNRWKRCGSLLAAVSQDYMCEPKMLAITGLDIPTHQRLTIERYDVLLPIVDGTHLMPVLQGYAPEDYVSHIRQYGDRLKPGMWVGVGSVCKRNGDPRAIEAVLLAIKEERPGLRLHGFRPEAYSSAIRDRSRVAGNCGFDGLELSGAHVWSQCERLAGGARVH